MFSIPEFHTKYPLGMMIGQGYIKNALQIYKYGYNSDLDNDVEEDIWSYGGTHYYSTTADIDSISSSSALDTDHVHVEGVDGDGNPAFYQVPLQGQTRVSFPGLRRVCRAYNDSGVSLIGTIYVYVNTAIVAGVPVDATKIRAVIDPQHQQTLMSCYTVPKGYTGYITRLATSLGGRTNGFATVYIRYREIDSVWKTKFIYDLASSGTSLYTATTTALPPIPEGTDIKCSAVCSANNMTIGNTWDIIMLKNV